MELLGNILESDNCFADSRQNASDNNEWTSDGVT